MRKTIATFALAAAAVFAGSGTALAYDDPDFGGSDVTIVGVEHTIVICGDFSECEGDEG
ncbi:hypothetical protein ACWDX6_00905 [Streptomyces sp. NPDC003027]